jgi:hypothetical protein
MLARDKHISLLQKFANYGCKKFHRIGTRWEVRGNLYSIFISHTLISLTTRFTGFTGFTGFTLFYDSPICKLDDDTLGGFDDILSSNAP